MKISEIINYLESLAHPSLQEHYDNAGLITGDPEGECTGVMISLDATEEVIMEAISRKCNCVVAHHPIIFGGLKKINARHYTGKAIIAAIKNDIAIYAIHTNLDNVIGGVNGKIAEVLGLQQIAVLAPKDNTLKKLYTFVPADKAEQVRAALFEAGGGQIGNYSECSFNTDGTGTFKAGKDTDPYVGERGIQHQEKETRIEMIFPAYLEGTIIRAMKNAHPYEEVAFDVVALANSWTATGSGLIGEFPEALTEYELLTKLKTLFFVPVIRHTPFLNKSIKMVAICGGAGSFLIPKALAAGAGAYITSDIKYHEFFEANSRILLADIGHYESEQFTIRLLHELLEQKFPNFAVLKTGVITNPVHYFGL